MYLSGSSSHLGDAVRVQSMAEGCQHELMLIDCLQPLHVCEIGVVVEGMWVFVHPQDVPHGGAVRNPGLGVEGNQQ